MSREATRLVVELYGVARELAGVREVELQLAAGGTIREALRVLAASHPLLMGPIIDPATWTVGPQFILNLEGRETVHDYDLEPREGARLLLISALVGGA